MTKSLYYFTYNSRGSESLPINTSCIFFSPFHLKWMCMNQLKRYCFWYTTNHVTWVMGNGINLKQNCSSSLLPTYHLLSVCVSLSPSTHFSRSVPIVPLHQIQPYTPAETYSAFLLWKKVLKYLGRLKDWLIYVCSSPLLDIHKVFHRFNRSGV